MKGFKEEYFNESPMSLQLLAACTVPKDQMMDPHPYLEELLRLNYSAERIQRKWRQFVHSREEEKRRFVAGINELLRELDGDVFRNWL